MAFLKWYDVQETKQEVRKLVFLVEKYKVYPFPLNDKSNTHH